MTANTAALVQRLRDALEAAMGDLVEPRATWGLGAVNAASTAIAAADRWLAEQPVQAVAQPLTDAQIQDAVRDADFDWMHGWTLDETLGNRFVALARTIEHAHGIGQQTRSHKMTYAYSLDGGETYHGSEPTPEDALGAAHDELSSEHEVGTTHSVHVARLVPGVEILRGKTIALEIVTEHVCVRLEEALYDEVGGDEQLIDDLTTGQRQSLGRAILEIIAATGAIKGQGLADDTVHQLTLEN